MQIDIKAAGILLVTLVLGIALGAVGTGALARQRTEAVQELRRRPGFVAHMEKVIQPHNDSQRIAIAPVLEATARTNDSIIGDANTRLRTTLDSMRAKLAPLLDEPQRARLNDIGRLPDPFHPPGDGGRRGGSPPDRPPPGGPPPQEGPPPRRGPPPDGGPPRKGPPPGGGPAAGGDPPPG